MGARVFEEMTPREMVRGLMRGERARFKAGYTAENAVLAVCEIQGEPAEGQEALQQYAEGFCYGITRTEYLEPFASQQMQAGYYHGLSENAAKCQPG